MKNFIIPLVISIFIPFSAFAASEQAVVNHTERGMSNESAGKPHKASSKHPQAGKHAGAKAKPQKAQNVSTPGYQELTNSQKALKMYQ